MNRQQIDKILFDSLKAKDEPATELNRQILEEWSKEDRTMKKNDFNKKAAAVACMCILATGSVSAYAAYHFLNPAQIAEETQNFYLKNAFEGSDAIDINETQISNGYNITLLGLVSGENLDEYIPGDKKSEIDMKKSYAAFAIEKADKTELNVNNLCISALVGGVKFTDLNNANMDGSLTWFKQDGILYELYACDNLEIFADRGVYLSVVDQFGNETAAFQMDAESGVYSKVENYAGTNALFKLPFDEKLADKDAAEQYLDSLKTAETNDNDEEMENGEMAAEAITCIDDKIQKFVDTITPENIDEYFTVDENYVFTATPDENNWIDFGTKYIKDGNEGYTINGGGGDLSNWIEKDQDFNVTGIVLDSDEEGHQSLSTLQIIVTFRNEDGSFTSATYNAKEGLEKYIK